MRIKQAVCYPIFKTEDMSFDTLFSGMAEIGFPAVELWTRQDDFDEMVAASIFPAAVFAKFNQSREPFIFQYAKSKNFRFRMWFWDSESFICCAWRRSYQYRY